MPRLRAVARVKHYPETKYARTLESLTLNLWAIQKATCKRQEAECGGGREHKAKIRRQDLGEKIQEVRHGR